jgi:pimeloyl-ACP methyl ester carboxylesterase
VECALWGDGPAVLALHGAMGGWDQGLLLARAAVGAPRFRFVAPSRPGYLRTPLGEARCPESQADLCAALLECLGVRDASVIAISGGGQCALQFALRYPDRCRALVMISACSATLQVRIPQLRFQFLKLLARMPRLAEYMSARARRNPDAAARRSIPDPVLRTSTLNDPEAGPLMAALQRSTMQHLAQRLPGTENDIQQSRASFSYPFEQISAPVLVLHGAEDEAVPVAQAKSLAGRVPEGTLFVVEGGRHTTLFTHLHQIRPRVAPFLDTYNPS